jgi:peptidoglycan/xylan/chitin deacetylase (PgdA/CDA1 family)
MKTCFILTFSLFFSAAYSQTFNEDTVKQDSAYKQLKAQVVTKLAHAVPGQWGSFVKGVDEDIVTSKKIMALTFDACGGPHGSGYDQELIDFLRQKKIPATLFLTGLWIDAHPNEVKALAADPLFEIENHGLAHHPCAIEGESRYGIKGTANVAQAVDEIELNALKIQHVTGRKPLYYRASTATTDEACTVIARELGETIISFDLLSGDAVANTPTEIIKNNLVRGAKDGALVIMHMNHPEWNGYEALRAALPTWQAMGFTFVKLENHPLKGKY